MPAHVFSPSLAPFRKLKFVSQPESLFYSASLAPLRELKCASPRAPITASSREPYNLSSLYFLIVQPEIKTLTSYNKYIGTATTICEVTSGLGVIIAAATKITTTACLRYLR